jgi:hypothetical protein
MVSIISPRFGVTFCRALAMASVLIAAPASAQIDISGQWAARVHEDQPHRGPGAEPGDFTGLPINAAARQRANHWDASSLSIPEEQSKPHAAQYFMRGPGPNLRIQKIADPESQLLLAYTLEGLYGRDDRVIWMDGRPHPSPLAEHTWDGYSTGKIEGNRLTVTTTHMKYGVIQRNGVPASIDSVMTEHFLRHGNFLTVVTIIDDPTYLEEPFIRTSHWVSSANVVPDGRFTFEIVDEVPGMDPNHVPQFPFPTIQSDWARKMGIPLEGAMGGKETLYPEFEAKLRRAIADASAARSSSK